MRAIPLAPGTEWTSTFPPRNGGFLSEPVDGLVSPLEDVEDVEDEDVAEDLRSDNDVDVAEGSAEVRLCPTPPSGGRWNVSIAKRFLRTLNPRLLTPLLDPPLAPP